MEAIDIKNHERRPTKTNFRHLRHFISTLTCIHLVSHGCGF